MNNTQKPIWNFFSISKKKTTHLCNNWTAFVFSLFLVGCSEEIYLTDNGQVFEEMNVLRSTKSIAPVTICTDAYIIVGGGSLGNNYQKFYKGTTCRTCMADVNDLADEEYIAGGFPEYGTATDEGSGGSSSKSYYVGDHWQFVFPTINKLYGYGSSLNIYQKGLLEGAMEKFKEQPTPFSDLYDWLVSNNIKIIFNIDPNIQAYAQYKVTANGCCISFKNESSINCYSLSEELVHAVQHQRFYKSSMDTKYKDYEFEAKVFRDIAYYIAYYYDNLLVSTESAVVFHDSRDTFVQKYTNWIILWAEKGYFPSSSFSDYQSLCKMWQGDSGTYLGNTPKLIEAFYRKPHPPLQPNN